MGGDVEADAWVHHEKMRREGAQGRRSRSCKGPSGRASLLCSEDRKVSVAQVPGERQREAQSMRTDVASAW